MSNESAIRREVGPIALMFTGLGSIIGSGWLFGAWRAAQIAGPDALYAWIIGAVIILLIALTYAELGALFPESGGTVRFGYYSHGSLVGFIMGWAAWGSIAAVIPVEAEASVQYMSSWPFAWARALYVHAANGQGELTAPGLGICSALLLIYFFVNFWSVKVFAGTNSAITVFKLVVPAATAVALMCTGFHAQNFVVGIHGGIHIGNLASILTAVATSGILMGYNGFQTPVNLAGEARDPGRSIPFAIIGSILLSGILYVVLQVALLGAVSPDRLGDGWAALEYSSPFAQLALALNLNWLAVLLYADAFVSPGGTGITYTATGARTLYAIQRGGSLPRMLGQLHPRFGIPRHAMGFNLVVSFIFLYFFRGWGKLAEVISIAMIIASLVVPISVLVMRRTARDVPRPLRVPALEVLAPVAFVLITLMLYWSRWPHTGEMVLLLILPLPVYLYYEAQHGWRDFAPHFCGGLWLIGYLLAITAMSWAGSEAFGGHGYVSDGWDQLCVAMIAVMFFFWGVRSGWRTPALNDFDGAVLRRSLVDCPPDNRRQATNTIATRI
jgi:amino acid transporter